MNTVKSNTTFQSRNMLTCSSWSEDVSLTEAGGQSATVACTGVIITSAVTVITPAFIFILVLVYISPVEEIMHSCVAVHAVLSTSAEVCVIVKHTVIDRTNCCRDSDATAVVCTETGG